MRPILEASQIAKATATALALVVASCSAPQKIQPSPAVTADTSAEDALFMLHNHHRSFHGAAPFQRDPELSDYAQIWAATMARSGSMKHSALRFVGSGYMAGSENVAFMQRTPQQVMDAWMNSPGHRRNILNGRYTHAGFAAAYDEAGRPFWCAVFGG